MIDAISRNIELKLIQINKLNANKIVSLPPIQGNLRSLKLGVKRTRRSVAITCLPELISRTNIFYATRLHLHCPY